MGLSTNTGFIKILDKVLEDNIPLAVIKMPSFDPRSLGLTFTDDEKRYLKRYWGRHWSRHWQTGMKSILVKAWIANKEKTVLQGLIGNIKSEIDSFVDEDVPRKRLIRLLRDRFDKEDI